MANVVYQEERKRDAEKKGDGDAIASWIEWRSDLQAPGARARLINGGQTYAAALEPTVGLLQARAGEKRLELTVVGARGEGRWHLVLRGAGLQSGTLRVLSGPAIVSGRDELLVPVQDSKGERSVVVFRSLAP